jgi:uncharacterized protein YecE (DUF72 family)
MVGPSADYSRNLVVHSHRMAGIVLSEGLRPADYLSCYAQHFDTVEVDSTFYATPNVSVVRSWNAKTPEGFLCAAKVPQEITHKRVLKDCDEEFKFFLTSMEALGEKLGPLLFQFGKFDKTMFRSLDDFLGRLVPFLKKLPKEHEFAVEIRNKAGLFLNWGTYCGNMASRSR